MTLMGVYKGIRGQMYMRIVGWPSCGSTWEMSDN
jgi:hypothetical protein